LFAARKHLVQGIDMADEDQGRWLSYQELGDLLRCTANAARMHAVRRNWPRRSPNRVGDCARVLVPEEITVRPRVMHDGPQYDAQCDAPPNGDDRAHVRAASDEQDVLRMVRETVEVLITPLREQLALANQRADRAEERAEEERTRANNAIEAASTAAIEAGDLRRQLEHERDRAEHAEERYVALATRRWRWPWARRRDKRAP
jgi:hypothetical protein